MPSAAGRTVSSGSPLASPEPDHILPPDPTNGRATSLGRKPRHGLGRLARLAALVVVLGIAGTLLAQRWLGPPAGGPLTALGTLEATEVTVSSEVTARVVEVLADKGDRVRGGDLLVQLDDALPRLQYRQVGSVEQQILQIQLAKYQLSAPRGGVVLRRGVQPGEVALAGSPLLVLADLDNLELTLYVLQRDLGRVYLGQTVEFEPLALPGQPGLGQVSAIRERAEYTPRSTQTARDRLNLVFAVIVRVPNPDHHLKPGLSVTARFVE